MKTVENGEQRESIEGEGRTALQKFLSACRVGRFSFDALVEPVSEAGLQFAKTTKGASK